jgi:hypothetical protein
MNTTLLPAGVEMTMCAGMDDDVFCDVNEYLRTNGAALSGLVQRWSAYDRRKKIQLYMVAFSTKLPDLIKATKSLIERDVIEAAAVRQ